MEQSSNDVIPTAIHVAAAVAMKESLMPGARASRRALGRKAQEFDDVVKIGRTHLQDATPIRLGQELSATPQRRSCGASAAEGDGLRWRAAARRDGGRHGHQFAPGVRQPGDREASRSGRGIDFVEARIISKRRRRKDGVVEASGQLKTIAISLTKIANDIRWLASGPRCGIGEIIIPATQPGSSIMPGKVNPVMSEMVLMVAAQVIGNDATIALRRRGLGNTSS